MTRISMMMLRIGLILLTFVMIIPIGVAMLVSWVLAGEEGLEWLTEKTGGPFFDWWGKIK